VAVHAQDIQPGYTLLYYSGTIDNYEKVEFNLQVSSYEVSGSYILEKSGEMFVFSGRLNLDRSGMGLLVYDQDNKYYASIEASIISVDGDYGRIINGIWKSGSGKIRKEINLKKVAEFAANDMSGLPRYAQLF